MRAGAFITTMLLFGLSLPAYAGDTKFYPATMCQGLVFKSYTTNVIGTSQLVTGFYAQPPTYSTAGAAGNASSSEMTLICPLVRDVERADGLGWTTLVVNAVNQSTTRTLTCTARTFFKSDHEFGSATSNSLGPLRDWTDLPLSVVSVPIDGYMLLHCTIPRQDPSRHTSGLASYRIDE